MTPVDSTNLTNDRFGFSCYAFVFPVPPSIQAKVAAIERASGMTRAKIPAHITVKGTFHKVGSLDEARAVARPIIEGMSSFRISFAGATVHTDSWGAGLIVEATAEMKRLHAALVEAFRPLVTTVYQDDPYRPHMTLYQEGSSEGIAAARALIEKADFGVGFDAYAVDLMGRHGPAYGGRWELIERYPLERASGPAPHSALRGKNR